MPGISETVFIGECEDGALTYASIAFRSVRLCLSCNNRVKCEMYKSRKYGEITIELRYCCFYVHFLPRTPEIKLRILFCMLIILKV